MASAKLPGLSEVQLKKAVVALLKYVGKRQEESTDLLEEDELLNLVGGRLRAQGLHACGLQPYASRCPGLPGAATKLLQQQTHIRAALPCAAGHLPEEDPAEAAQRQAHPATHPAPPLPDGGRRGLPIRQGPQG